MQIYFLQHLVLQTASCNLLMFSNRPLNRAHTNHIQTACKLLPSIASDALSALSPLSSVQSVQSFRGFRARCSKGKMVATVARKHARTTTAWAVA
jgi:hypothetical protein